MRHSVVHGKLSAWRKRALRRKSNVCVQWTYILSLHLEIGRFVARTILVRLSDIVPNVRSVLLIESFYFHLITVVFELIAND